MHPRHVSARVRLVASVVAVVIVGASACGGGSADGTAPAGPVDTGTSSSVKPVAGPLVAATAAWKLDKPWSRAVVLNDHGQLLVFSGLDSAKRSLDRVVRIDPATGHIAEAAKLPRVVHDAAGTFVGGSALLIGGGEQESGYSEITAVTGPHSGQVIGHLPEPRSDGAALTLGDTAYVIGGFDGKNLPPAILATTDGTAFRAVTNLNPTVRYPAVAATAGKIYIFGGKTATGQTDAIQRYDPTDNTIATVGHFPVPLGHALAFELAGTIYIAGGRTGTATSDAENKITTQVSSFDPTTNTLTPAGNLPYGVADAGAAVIGDRAYIVGGENGSDVALATAIVLNH